MSKRFRLIAPAVAFAVVAAILYAQENPQSELAGSLEKLQRQLQDLQAQTRGLQEQVRKARKEAREEERKAKQRPAATAVAQPASPPVPQTPVEVSPAEAAAANFQKSLDAYAQGAQLQEQKSYRAAIDAYSDAIRFDPRNDSAFLRRGDCYAQLGDYGNASADYSQSLTIQPDNSHAYLSRAIAYAALGKDQLAMADLNEAMVRDPNNPDSLLLRGRLLQTAGDHQRAATDYTVALSLSPDSETAYLGRAVSLREQGLIPLAISDCDNVVRLNPGSPSGYLCRSESYSRAGTPDKAVEQLNQAILATQTLRQPLALLNSLLVQTVARSRSNAAAGQGAPLGAPGQPEPAQPTPTQSAQVTAAAPQLPAFGPQSPPRPPAPAPAPEAIALPQSPRFSSPPSPAGPGSVAAPSNSSAATRLTKVNPEDAIYYERLGRVRLGQMDFAAAAKNFNQAIDADPTLASAFNGRGFAYFKLRNLAQAISDFSSAIRLNSMYLNAYHNRAVARRVNGDNAGAAEDDQKALEILRGSRSAGTVKPR